MLNIFRYGACYFGTFLFERDNKTIIVHALLAKEKECLRQCVSIMLRIKLAVFYGLTETNGCRFKALFLNQREDLVNGGKCRVENYYD